jgi:mycothiol synthase
LGVLGFATAVGPYRPVVSRLCTTVRPVQEAARRIEVKRHMQTDDIAAVSELLDIAAVEDHHRALGEHQWLDLVHGGRAGFAGLVAWEEGHDHPVGYAQVSRGEGNWAVEFVVDPHHREDNGSEIGTELLTAAMAIVADEGGGHVHLWMPKPAPWQEQVAESVGLKRGRDLLQMRRPLPLDGSLIWQLDVRPFVVGKDEEAWLDVNNRAFAWHPEQGGWSVETIKAREAEPWFDPEGFLLHERDGRLAGFCWTKVHADVDPPLGEIYVIAVDPDFHGHGLGRALVLAGLDHLASKGLRHGMLYVDGTNEHAIELYRRLGFGVDHVDRAYTGDVPATPT